jgi:hypothetical protein
MPTTRRRAPRFQQDWCTQNHIDWLYDEPFDRDRHDWFIYHGLDRDDPAIRELDTLDPPRRVPFLESAVTGRRLWGMFGAGITDEHVEQYPGTRPARWWQFDAPEPRRRVGGTGTPCHERLADVLRLTLGVPTDWITRSDVETYNLTGTPLDVPALDPADPPTYESEAAYLERLSLFAPGERKRLKPRDFKPESVIDILGLTIDD